jgi:hypothetical protein
MQDEKMESLREDIDSLEEEAKRHEARIASSEQKVADFQQQIADLPPPPQVPHLHLIVVKSPCTMPKSCQPAA